MILGIMNKGLGYVKNRTKLSPSSVSETSYVRPKGFLEGGLKFIVWVVLKTGGYTVAFLTFLTLAAIIGGCGSKPKEYFLEVGVMVEGEKSVRFPGTRRSVFDPPADYIYAGEWGSEGSGPGRVSFPVGYCGRTR